MECKTAADSLDGKDGVRLHDDSLEGKLPQSREGH
jgi:hypothetical protein